MAAAVSHIEFLTFDRIALESYVIPHFLPILMHWFHWYGYFYYSRSSRGQNKMAAVGHLEFLCFDVIALESHVIPHFWLIWIHWFHWYDYFYDLRSSRGQNQDGCRQPYWIFNFWQNSPRILCNTSFLTNLNAPIQLVWLFLWFKVI